MKNYWLDKKKDQEAQRCRACPHIYGFITPVKHIFKMVDGDPKCNQRWKRIELMSSICNCFIMEDLPGDE